MGISVGSNHSSASEANRTKTRFYPPKKSQRTCWSISSVNQWNVTEHATVIEHRLRDRIDNEWSNTSSARWTPADVMAARNSAQGTKHQEFSNDLKCTADRTEKRVASTCCWASWWCHVCNIVLLNVKVCRSSSLVDSCARPTTWRPIQSLRSWKYLRQSKMISVYYQIAYRNQLRNRITLVARLLATLCLTCTVAWS